jgi:hypothetical protein
LPALPVAGGLKLIGSQEPLRPVVKSKPNPQKMMLSVIFIGSPSSLSVKWL